MTKFDTQVKKLLTESSKEEPIMTVDKYGTKKWHLKNGKLHREDGPAIEHSEGTKVWYINNKRHRIDGPAVVWSGGDKEWYINGKLHREDGPAVEWSNGDKAWYIDGEKLSEDKWKAWVNIKKNVSPEHQQNVLDILDL